MEAALDKNTTNLLYFLPESLADFSIINNDKLLLAFNQLLEL